MFGCKYLEYSYLVQVSWDLYLKGVYLNLLYKNNCNYSAS